MRSDTARDNSFRATLQEKLNLRIVRNRADCPQCQGRSRLTMSVNSDFAHCFRCGYTIQFRKLAPELVPPETPEQRAERVLEREFREWLDCLYWIICDELYRLTLVVCSAKRTLALFPDNETAWEELRAFYDAEPHLMAPLDQLCFEKVSQWIHYPLSRDKLRQAFDEARRACADAA